MRLHFVFILLTFLPTVVPGAFVQSHSGTLACTLPAPAAFTAERTSQTTAALEWSPVNGAASYRLVVYDLDTWELVSSTTEYGTTKNLNGLAPGARYRCTLASMCGDGTTSEFVISDNVLE